eukprot:Polyplicarium_translucidae@DN486_c0_g1_i1.p2
MQMTHLISRVTACLSTSLSSAIGRRALICTATRLSQKRAHAGSRWDDAKPKINVKFANKKDGTEKSVRVPVGVSILEAAHSHDVDLEGACEASLACSTCHVHLEPEVYTALPEPSEREDDLLDMAPCLTDTSRLGCQVLLDESHEGIIITLPPTTFNFYVDGHVPKPH